jgi:hypothetical protein
MDEQTKGGQPLMNIEVLIETIATIGLGIPAHLENEIAGLDAVEKALKSGDMTAVNQWLNGGELTADPKPEKVSVNTHLEVVWINEDGNVNGYTSNNNRVASLPHETIEDCRKIIEAEREPSSERSDDNNEYWAKQVFPLLLKSSQNEQKHQQYRRFRQMAGLSLCRMRELSTTRQAHPVRLCHRLPEMQEPPRQPKETARSEIFV